MVINFIEKKIYKTIQNSDSTKALLKTFQGTKPDAPHQARRQTSGLIQSEFHF